MDIMYSNHGIGFSANVKSKRKRKFRLRLTRELEGVTPLIIIGLMFGAFLIGVGVG